MLAFHVLAFSCHPSVSCYPSLGSNTWHLSPTAAHGQMPFLSGTVAGTCTVDIFAWKKCQHHVKTRGKDHCHNYNNSYHCQISSFTSGPKLLFWNCSSSPTFSNSMYSLPVVFTSLFISSTSNNSSPSDCSSIRQLSSLLLLPALFWFFGFRPLTLWVVLSLLGFLISWLCLWTLLSVFSTLRNKLCGFGSCYCLWACLVWILSDFLHSAFWPSIFRFWLCFSVLSFTLIIVVSRNILAVYCICMKDIGCFILLDWAYVCVHMKRIFLHTHHSGFISVSTHTSPQSPICFLLPSSVLLLKMIDVALHLLDSISHQLLLPSTSCSSWCLNNILIQSLHTRHNPSKLTHQQN